MCRCRTNIASIIRLGPITSSTHVEYDAEMVCDDSRDGLLNALTSKMHRARIIYIEL